MAILVCLMKGKGESKGGFCVCCKAQDVSKD